MIVKIRKSVIAVLILSLVIISCTTLDQNQRLLQHGISKNNTVVLIPQLTKNTTNYKLFATFGVTIINRESKKRVKVVTLSHSGKYTIVAGLPPGKYAISHVAYKKYPGVTPPVPKLTTSFYDMYYPFDVVKDSIVVTEITFLKQMYIDKKSGVLKYTLATAFSDGGLAIEALKQFFTGYPDYSYFRKDRINIGLLINNKQEIVGTRYWITKSNDIIVELPSVKASGTATANFRSRTIVIPKNEKNEN